MKKPVIQKHHVSYDPEIIVYIFRGEHWIITQLNRRTKNISVGFIHSIIKWLLESISKAVDLTDSNNTYELYRNDFYNLFRRIGMLDKFKNIKVVDYWRNIYSGVFYFRVKRGDKDYIVGVRGGKVTMDDLYEMDDTFDNLNKDKFSVEKVEVFDLENNKEN